MADGFKRRGRHPEKQLTAVKVRNAGEGRYFDGSGLTLIVDRSGARRWVLRINVKGKRTEIGLGGTATVSLADARDEAARLRKIARAGGDPLTERRNQLRVIPTFEVAAREAHGSISSTFKNPKHRDQWINTLVDYVFPKFGDRLIDQVDSSDVLKALTPIWVEKPETARRVRQRIRSVLDWAKAKRLRSGDNPVHGIEKVLPKHRTSQEHHAALPYQQTPHFIKALRESEAGQITQCAFELMILTATRTSEVRLAKWTEFNLKEKTWTIPADRMKAGREHRVPLASRCIEIIAKVRELGDGGDYVFPGRTIGQPMSNTVFLMTLRRMKHGNITGHGFRSTFRDWAEEKTGFPRSVVEAALAHVVENKVEAAYLRTDLFEKRRELMKQWATFATATPAKVVRMRA